MEISDIQINGRIMTITFCGEDAEDIMEIKITIKDAEFISKTLNNHTIKNDSKQLS